MGIGIEKIRGNESGMTRGAPVDMEYPSGSGVLNHFSDGFRNK